MGRVARKEWWQIAHLDQRNFDPATFRPATDPRGPFSTAVVARIEQMEGDLGINAPCAARLASAKKAGVVFTDTLTIGHMSLSVPEDELATIARTLELDPAIGHEIARDRFADRFFQLLLGAKNLRSVDYSSYQGADILHDMNQPIPVELHESCDVLYDGGTMEHIFDVKQVMTNYMNLVRPGGHIFINVPANNLFGHGFYQFSSEFFYRVFGPGNGFVVRDVLLIEAPFTSVEAGRNWRCFRTVDPAAAGKRIRLVSDKPLMLFVEAERTERVVPFAHPPMQSDYQTRWETAEDVAPPVSGNAPKGQSKQPFTYLSPWQDLKRRLKQRRKHSLRNRRFFERISPL